ncbi:MAG: hypothetical protein EZS28_052415, partial [Streblomastix strix]
MAGQTNDTKQSIELLVQILNKGVVTFHTKVDVSVEPLHIQLVQVLSNINKNIVISYYYANQFGNIAYKEQFNFEILKSKLRQPATASAETSSVRLNRTYQQKVKHNEKKHHFTDKSKQHHFTDKSKKGAEKDLRGAPKVQKNRIKAGMIKAETSTAKAALMDPAA